MKGRKEYERTVRAVEGKKEKGRKENNMRIE